LRRRRHLTEAIHHGLKEVVKLRKDWWQRFVVGHMPEPINAEQHGVIPIVSQGLEQSTD
jgi:hypothetical protein